MIRALAKTYKIRQTMATALAVIGAISTLLTIGLKVLEMLESSSPHPAK